MANGPVGRVGKVGKTVRAVARVLREDLWTTTSADPLPRAGEPDWPVWRPVLGLAVVMFALGVAIFGVNSIAREYGVGTRYGAVFGMAQALTLVVAFFRPVLPAWWASTILMVVLALLSEPLVASQDVLFPWNPSGLAAQSGVLLLLASRVRPRAAAEALAISVLAGLAIGLAAPSVHNFDMGRATVILSASAVLGAALRGRRVARTQLIEQTEITAEERARRTLLEERNRIARELHDVVAHHMSVISIQAQVAPHLVENPSDELRENLAGIRQNAVDALNELRHVLGVLRSEDALADGVRHAPQPTLDRLDELVTTVRGAGVTVATEVTGVRRPLPPSVELSAFRIVQEALSNAMRHAPGADVRVEVVYHPAGVTVRVTNTAPTHGPAAKPSSRGIGHGLLGMRERAAMLGGDFVNGPTPGGGYEVMAKLPLEDTP